MAVQNAKSRLPRAGGHLLPLWLVGHGCVESREWSQWVDPSARSFKNEQFFEHLFFANLGIRTSSAYIHYIHVLEGFDLIYSVVYRKR